MTAEMGISLISRAARVATFTTLLQLLETWMEITARPPWAARPW